MQVAQMRGPDESLLFSGFASVVFAASMTAQLRLSEGYAIADERPSKRAVRRFEYSD